ncbi:MAG: flagellar biosynthesis protein FlgN [Spirochaetes bacterium]|nr:flagellar biosynthesis protein FlgN [Spirochaetota bacterium]
MADIPADVLEERKAILRRFRELLLAQREKFARYLAIAGHERSDIEKGDVDALVSHVELERSIVSEIFTFQKAIDPLEDLYREAYPHAGAHDIPEIKTALEDLRCEIVRRNEENRLLLRQRMDMIREEIKSVRNPFAKKRSVYADADEPTMIDIKG